MTTNVRYIAKERLVYADFGGVTLDVVGMMDTPELATLAAAGMNYVLHPPRQQYPAGPALTPGTDFRSSDAPTEVIPAIRGRRFTTSVRHMDHRNTW
jgi:hypothetical protein